MWSFKPLCFSKCLYLYILFSVVFSLENSACFVFWIIQCIRKADAFPAPQTRAVVMSCIWQTFHTVSLVLMASIILANTYCYNSIFLPFQYSINTGTKPAPFIRALAAILKSLCKQCCKSLFWFVLFIQIHPEFSHEGTNVQAQIIIIWTSFAKSQLLWEV